MRFSQMLVVVGSAISASAALASNPWADRVEAYFAGSGVPAGYDNPAAALGSPTRVNSAGESWANGVTPFNSAYESSSVVSIGRGGSLTVSFDEAVTNDALNPFGIDLLIFGNQFYVAGSDGRVTGIFDEGGTIELSTDGVHWVMATGLSAEGGFATNGFLDTVDLQFGSDVGTIPTDFTRPVDPSLNPIGLTREQLVAAYNGSGGGLGIDIGAYGLESVRFVRISNAFDAAGTPEIDGFADVAAVPAPGAIGVLAVAAMRRRRR